VLVLFVLMSCRVGIQLIWRTTAKMETSTLQNIYTTKIQMYLILQTVTM